MLYKSPHANIGRVCQVEIGNDWVKRTFSPDAITASGLKTKHTPERIEYFFENEKKWLKILESEWIPKTLEIGSNFIIQEYTRPALIYEVDDLPDIKGQLIEMYKFFKQKNVFKRNGSVSNMTMRSDQLVAFDFKWAKERPEGLDLEFRSYDEWLVKVDPEMPRLLRELL